MRQRTFRPDLERVEARCLLSVAPISVQRGAAGRGGVILAEGAGSPGAATDSPPQNRFLTPTGTPSLHEMRRQRVRLTFDGKFVQGRPRFSDTQSQVYIKGVGTSTFFLHGDLQLGAYVPKDLATPTSGQATSYDRNNNTNAAFGIDLLGSTASLDRAGRPTQFAFTMDQNISAGIFGASIGSGTVKIRYTPNGKVQPGILSQGRAQVVIVGDVYTYRTSGILAVLGSRNTTNPNKIRF